MNRQIATILMFIFAALPAYIGADEAPSKESAQQDYDSSYGEGIINIVTFNVALEKDLKQDEMRKLLEELVN